jgi:hypothetical protein
MICETELFDGTGEHIRPTVGMFLGNGRFKDTQIGLWARTLDVKKGKCIVIDNNSKGNSGNNKSYKCSSQDCEWRLRISRHPEKDEW